MKRKRVKVLNIPIDDKSKKEIQKEIKLALEEKRELFISTVNSSFVLRSLENRKFKKYLQEKSHINTPDGVGIQLAAEYVISNLNKKENCLRFFFKWFMLGILYVLKPSKKFSVLSERVTGISLTKFLLNLANEDNLKVLIFHKKNALMSKKELERKIKTKYKKLAYEIINIEERQAKIKKVYKGDIALADLGEVRQEMFLYNNKEKIKSKVYIGIGSSLDVIFNRIKPTPKSFSSRGLEWLYRIFIRPKRLKKAFKSVIIFPYKLCTERLKNTK